MKDLRAIDRDQALPSEIEHRCEEMLDGDRLTQKYNYVAYHFENGGYYYWTRAYLEDIETVTPLGPLDNRTSRRPAAGPIGVDMLLIFNDDFERLRPSAMKDTR